MKKCIPILFSVLLLSGCWDENLYKNLAIIELVGFDGEAQKTKGYYTVPKVSKNSVEYSVLEGEGNGSRDSRYDANRKSGQIIDLSQIQVMLFSEEMVRNNDFYDYLDAFFRTPRYRLNARVAIVDGSTEDFVNVNLEIPSDLPDFYRQLIDSSVTTSEVEDISLQKACSILFDKGIDLTLPNIELAEGKPKLKGVALFSKQKFSGFSLTSDETILLNTMKNTTKKYAKQSYIWDYDGKKNSLAFDISKIKKKWKIEQNGDSVKLKANYQLIVTLDEFAHNHLRDKKVTDDMTAFLNKKIEEEYKKVFEKLQDAKSDALGVGREVRAFHPDIWDKADWHDTFKNMEFDVTVKTKIESTGILH